MLQIQEDQLKQLSQREMRAEVFRSLLPVGVTMIHWISESRLDSPSGRRGLVRFRAEFRGSAPAHVPAQLTRIAQIVDSQPRRVTRAILEFEILYDRAD